MIPRWQIRVAHEDGEFTVTTTAWAWQQWEEHFNTKLSRLSDGVGVRDLAFLAYQAARGGPNAPADKFDQWRRRIIDVEIINQETENPTPAAASAD